MMQKRVGVAVLILALGCSGVRLESGDAGEDLAAGEEAETGDVLSETFERCPCPDGNIGMLRTESRFGGPGPSIFDWYHAFEPATFGAGDELVLQYAVVPFTIGGTSVGLDAVGGITFFGGVPMVPLVANEWNCVHVRIRFEWYEYVVEVNGEELPPEPLPNRDAPWSVWAVRIYTSREDSEPAVAAMDSLAVIKVPAHGSPTVLYRDDFDDLRNFEDGWVGEAAVGPPPVALPMPPGCR